MLHALAASVGSTVITLHPQSDLFESQMILCESCDLHSFVGIVNVIYHRVTHIAEFHGQRCSTHSVLPILFLHISNMLNYQIN